MRCGDQRAGEKDLMCHIAKSPQKFEFPPPVGRRLLEKEFINALSRVWQVFTPSGSGASLWGDASGGGARGGRGLVVGAMRKLDVMYGNSQNFRGWILPRGIFIRHLN